MNIAVEAPRMFVIFVGVICSAIALAILGLIVLLCYRVIEGGETPANSITALAVLVPVGFWFAFLGYRLLLNRATHSGGLLSPIAWKLLGILFGGIAALLLCSAIWQQKWEILYAPVLAIVFATWCFSNARNRATEK